MAKDDELYERGMQARKSVMGSAAIERAQQAYDDIDKEHAP
jgi:hypothetical protein